MSAETIGLVSGLLVVASVIPYSIRTYLSKVPAESDELVALDADRPRALAHLQEFGCRSERLAGSVRVYQPTPHHHYRLATTWWVDETKPS